MLHVSLGKWLSTYPIPQYLPVRSQDKVFTFIALALAVQLFIRLKHSDDVGLALPHEILTVQPIVTAGRLIELA